MFNLEITEDAKKDLSLLEKHTAQRILKKIRWLAENAETINHIPLKGQFSGNYKLRVGDYRVIYIIKDEIPKIVSVLNVGHRREVYK